MNDLLANDKPNLERRIKKHIHGKPQVLLLTPSPGFSKTLESEILQLLPQTIPAPTLRIVEGQIWLHDAPLSLAYEILQKSHALREVELLVAKGRTSHEASLLKICEGVEWNMYLNPQIPLRITVDSVASHQFHERGIKETLLKHFANLNFKLFNNDNTESGIIQVLSLQLRRDVASFFLSLGGPQINHRAYKKSMNHKAPLKEDLAACAIIAHINAIESQKTKGISSIYVPFAGSGTLGYECVALILNLAPAQFQVPLNLSISPFFQQKTYDHLKKLSLLKALKEFSISPQKINLQFLEQNTDLCEQILQTTQLFKTTLPVESIDSLQITTEHQDFFEHPFPYLEQHLFMPLNPPYGIRLEATSSSESRPFKTESAANYYVKIAKKIDSEIKKSRNNRHISGFILCPDEESWKSFQQHMTLAQFKTQHFSQGGLDIRLLHFWSRAL